MVAYLMKRESGWSRCSVQKVDAVGAWWASLSYDYEVGCSGVLKLVRKQVIWRPSVVSAGVAPVLLVRLLHNQLLHQYLLLSPVLLPSQPIVSW